MSVRAYKVKEIATGESFNLWHDEGLMEALEKLGLLGGLNKDGGGCIIIEREDLEKIKGMVDEFDNEVSESLEQIEVDIAKDGWARYICF